MFQDPDTKKYTIKGFVVPIGEFVFSAREGSFKMFKCLNFVEYVLKSGKTVLKNQNIEKYLVKLDCKTKVHDKSLGNTRNYSLVTAYETENSVIVQMKEGASNHLVVRYDKDHTSFTFKSWDDSSIEKISILEKDDVLAA